MRQRAQGAVRGGVGVATDNGHARQRCPLLRPDHVHNALTLVVHVQFENTEIVAVLVQGLHLNTGNGIADAFQPLGTLITRCRDIVVGGGKVGIGTPGATARHAQALEGLRRGDFVNQLPVDINQCRAIITLSDQMGVPEFVV